jgi:hypothetical protein
MVWSRFTSILFAIVVIAPLTDANAQNVKGVVRDPADPKAAVPPVRYESAFARYRANAEAEVGAWRDTNDNVGRIGGWRIYGREAIEEPKADKPPAAGSRSEGDAAAKPDNGHAHRGAR